MPVAQPNLKVRISTPPTTKRLQLKNIDAREARLTQIKIYLYYNNAWHPYSTLVRQHMNNYEY